MSKFKTTDGQTFDTPEEAVLHAMKLDSGNPTVYEDEVEDEEPSKEEKAAKAEAKKEAAEAKEKAKKEAAEKKEADEKAKAEAKR